MKDVRLIGISHISFSSMLIKLFLITLVVFGFNVVESRGQLAPCANDNGQNCTPWSNDIMRTIAAPNFPLCSLEVCYQTRVCNGQVQYRVIFAKILNDQACQGYIQALFPNGLLGNFNSVLYRQNLQEIYDQLCIDIFENAYNQLPSQDKYLYECPNGYYTINRVEGSCTSLCRNYYDLPNPQGG